MRTTAELFPFLLDCRMVHLLLLLPPGPTSSTMSTLQSATFVELADSSGSNTLDWTMRHSFRAGNVVFSAGEQSTMLTACSAAGASCTTMLAVVQFHPVPGQLGPA